LRHVSYSMTLCVPRCTYFPLLPLLIEPIPYFLAFLFNSVSFSHFFLNLLSMPYQFLFVSYLEINVYIFTALIRIYM
jgi:hypothetical protein